MKKKDLEEKIFLLLMKTVTALTFLLLMSIVWILVKKGFSALSWEILTTLPKGGFYYGGGGGILNALLGSLYLAFGSTALSFIISISLALLIHIQLQKYAYLQNIIRFGLDILWGIPSIVYGAFAFICMQIFDIRTSLLSGIIIIAVLIMPIMTRALDEALRHIPFGLKEACYALGSTNAETAWKIYLKKMIPSIITAGLLGFSRAIGDTAAVLFTAGYTDYLPESLYKPVATLPLTIFFLLSSPVKEVQDRAYAASVVLIMIILLTSTLVRYSHKLLSGDDHE